MKRGVKFISWYLEAALPYVLCLLTVACSGAPDSVDYDVADDATGQAAMSVTLRIAVGGAETTRGMIPETDVEEAGSVAENHIDIANGNFRILFFSATDDRYLQMLKPETVRLLPAVASEKLYEMQGVMQEPLPSDFKIVVLANWGETCWNRLDGLLTSGVTIEDICTNGLAVYDYTSVAFEPSPDGASPKVIPMYGVKTCTGISQRPDVLAYLGTIDMLRAMAKVEVVCEDDNATITGIAINCANDRGFCAPKGMYGNTTNNSTALHIPVGTTALAGDVAQRKYGGDGVGKAVLYIPEYDNADGKALMEVSFRTTQGTRTGYIYFRDSGSSEPYHIVRDYLYRYMVRFKEDITIDYTLCPWGEYRIDIPEFE